MSQTRRLPKVDPPPVDQRFSRTRRLQARREFDETIRLGIRIPDRDFTVYIRRRSTEKSRLGLVIPRAIGPAPTRNRLRRRLREAFRTNVRIAGLGADFVVAARPGAGAASFAEVRRLLGRAAARAQVPDKPRGGQA